MTTYSMMSSHSINSADMQPQIPNPKPQSPSPRSLGLGSVTLDFRHWIFGVPPSAFAVRALDFVGILGVGLGIWEFTGVLRYCIDGVPQQTLTPAKPRDLTLELVP